MLSTIPVDTPTNWTALATGATAARSGITGFAFYRPGESLVHKRGPGSDYGDFRAAEFLWEAADRQGKRSLVVNYPFAWHSRDLAHGVIVGGDSLAGGRPAICRGRCLCTADREGAMVQATTIGLRREGQIWTADLDPGFRLRTAPGPQPRLVVEDAAGGELARIAQGEWSQYEPAQLSDGVGWVRFFLVHLSSDGSSLQLLHSTVTRETGWTKPDHYAAELVKACGPYQQGEETGNSMSRYGWTGPHDLEAQIDVLRTTADIQLGYARWLTQAEPDWDHLYFQLHANDGISHQLLGHFDPAFPLATPDSTRVAQTLIRANYVETDRILGEAAALAQEHDALLVVVSDHSAIPTHTWVDTARPFVEKGWLRFAADGKWDPDGSKVRKMINHSIYINLEGRQPDGIVDPGEYESVRDEIISTLLAMRDPRTGACPIALAARREDMDGVGGNGPGFGDVIYLMRPGYTNQPASEGEALTRDGLARFVSDPDEALAAGYTYHSWIMGNHHDYLPNAEYPGVCSNRAILLVHGPGVRQGQAIVHARTIDVAPTLAHYAGIDPPAQAEGHALAELFDLAQ